MAPNLKDKMFTFWKFNGVERGTVKGAALKNYDDDMEAALLEMRTFLQKETGSSKSGMVRLWTTNNLSSGSKPPLLSALKSGHILITESYNFFQSNPPQPDDESYTASSVCITENYPQVMKRVKLIGKSLEDIATLPNYESFPRIYLIAQEIVSRTGGDFGIQFLIDCLKRFQRKINLSLEELWTIPVVLQLVIVEHIGLNLAGVAMKAIFSKHSEAVRPRNLKELLQIGNEIDLSKSESEFLSKIRVHVKENFKAFDFIIPCIGCAHGHSDLDISLLMKNLSLLSSIEWEEIGFVENLSIVDQMFAKGSGKNFGSLDRSTKSRYRSAVHEICKNSSKSEGEIAKLAVELSECHDNKSDIRKSDIGYYLIDDGLPILQKMSKMKLSAVQKFRQYFYPTISIFDYIKGILFLSITLSILFSQCFITEFSNRLQIVFICTFLVATHWAIEIIYYLVTKFATPSLLPRFDFSKSGIPKKYRTIVVIPCLISDFESISNLVSKLEIRFVGNKDENLDFALLTDFKDSDRGTLPTDQALLDYLKAKILSLNVKYSNARNDKSSIFYAFHRPRVFNPVDNIWMGYERKRGKLAAFANFLRGIEMEKFNFVVGDISKLKSIKYVITLDTDTSLPRDAARKLVGTMAHPLNRPVSTDDKQQSIDRGYGILQPRISLNLPAADSTLFSKIFSANYSGLDPYSHTVSNVYQDLFAESSYVGKGIFDVDIFQKVLAGKFQENRILSHDLLEGNYLRTGFAGDVQLYEDFSQSYISEQARRHRWVRGDWQNVDYLWASNLSALSKWKIFDNLRRSLIPMVELLTFLFYWQTLPILCLLGMRLLFSLLLKDLISFTALLFKFNRKSKYFFELPRRRNIIESMALIWRSVLLFSFEISCIPNEAFQNFDAIYRTIYRRLVSKTKLLEWTVFASSNIVSDQKLENNLRKMWPGPLVFLCMIFSMKTDPILIPLLICWGLSPIFAWCLCQSPKITPKRSVLSNDDISFLRGAARKTWSYFEQFSVAEENYLPPDNYREFPNESIAHRTSPTNIGLGVLANLSAYDFGYLSCGDMVERISNTLNTLLKLEKFRGHLYNWYDTQTADILQPKYVSSVDSGNLAASLLVLRQGLLALPNEPFISNRMFEGLLDTLRLSFDELRPRFFELGLQLQSTLVEALENQNSVSEMYQYLRTLQMISSSFSTDFESKKFVWFQKFEGRLASALDELSTFAPWLLLDRFPVPVEFFDVLNRPASLRDLAEYPLILKSKSHELSVDTTNNNKFRLDGLTDAINLARTNALQMISSLEQLAETCENLNNQMEYDFLYDAQRHLLRIGYNVDKNLPDDSCYDLLASEARLGIFAAVAQGQIPQETWFKLGRKLTKDSKVLQSWTGSMFEYLMPQLLIPTLEQTQLSKTFKEIVRIQIDYGRRYGIPWGISESSCSEWVSVSEDYFYRPAGMKELSLDPMLENSFAIAPYATMLAMMICPKEACLNLKRMSSQGFEGTYGFYEAGDFTPAGSGTVSGECKTMVRSFMAHHQAMSFLALENVLLNEPMQRRLEEDPNFQSSLILLT